MVTLTVYVPAMRPVGMLIEVAELANVPVAPTVIGEVVTVRAVTTSVELISCAVTALEPGVKPEPLTGTAAPPIVCAATRVMAGVASNVKVADAVLPAPSVTVTVREPVPADAEITVPLFAARSPVAPVVTAPVIKVAGVTDVSYQLAAVPFNVRVCSTAFPKPVPVITTVAPALIAEGVKVILGTTVKVAVADAPDVLPTTVTVCAPATVEVGMLKPEFSSIPPLLLITVRPTGVAAVIVVASNFTVIVSPARNPEPVKDNVAVPRTLEVGDIVTLAATIVKVATAVLTGAPVPSAAAIVCEPATKGGTTKVAIICPVAVNDEDAAATVTPSIVNAAAAPEFLYPEPTMVTVVPSAAEDGLTILMVGAPVVV